VDPIQEKDHDFIGGYHAVRGSLIHGTGSTEELWLAKGKDNARTREIVRLARERGVPVRRQHSEYLDRFLPQTAHQGMIAVGRSFQYANLVELVERSRTAADPGLLLVADHITDEGNLGSIIRTGAFFGAQGLILPRDRSARVTPQVIKRSSGTHMRLPMARVVNIGRTLDLLTQKDFWIVGTSGRGSQSIYDVDWEIPVAVVLGSEQKGIGPLVGKRCHQMVRIPSPGGVDSLNVAVACGVILSEISRCRTAANLPAQSPK
jgi:23S rRNA (guanosine2251-2'-O)-methyltransferase